MDKKLIRHIRATLIERERLRIHSLKAEMDSQRNWSDRLADHINNAFGSMAFFNFHAILFTSWILINVNWIPGIPAFDPFPFGLLTMVVSLEAIFLSIFVLISQNRAAKIADVREEIDLQVNVQAEQEITRLVMMVNDIHDRMMMDPTAIAKKRRVKKFDLEKIKEDILFEIGQ